MTDKLPIEAVQQDLLDALKHRDEAILQAPPGAGKTTMVPLKFLDQVSGMILMLEPRRIAARNAAHRMAQLLGESVGQTVGYRMRLDNKVGPNTRIMVVTEGVMLRMLQDDPGLDGVDLVIFDEFHERSLDADFALALCLKTRELFRDTPLKLLVMSATLDRSGLSALLNDAPEIVSEGRSFPVDLIYQGPAKPGERIVPRMFSAIQEALTKHPASSILAFLPGEGEIRQLQSELAKLPLNNTLVAPLFGNLSIEAQAEAIRPSPAAKRKVVLATNVAETSLTIEGVDVVIDSGLERRARFDPNTATSRLQTQRIAQSSATQRAGRAGRMAPGHCYRLWSKDQQQQLATTQTPDIQQADLGNLALSLLNWGLDSPADLIWLDAPPTANWRQALDQLFAFGAIDPKGTGLTRHGEHMAQLALSPRIAHMLVSAAEFGQLETGSALAALLSERDPLGRDPAFGAAVDKRISLINGDTPCPGSYRPWLKRTQTLAKQFYHQGQNLMLAPSAELDSDQELSILIATAFPDRIARQRHGGGYQLTNGRSAKLIDDNPGSGLKNSKWLAAAEVTGSGSGNDVIRSAVTLDAKLFDGALSHLIHHQRIVEWDKKQARFVAEQQTRIGSLVLKREALPDLSADERVEAICAYVREQGLKMFKHRDKLQVLQQRCRYLAHQSEVFQIDDEQLLNQLPVWLGPYLAGKTKLDDIAKLNIHQILLDRLSYAEQQALDKAAPLRIGVPSGSNIQINYAEEPPVLAVKLQEMFGCDDTPTINHGKVKLLVHLLSPAGRPLQVTQDLAGFWRGSYESVRKEMRGRYPKHPWPEDPTKALPTRKTKPR